MKVALRALTQKAVLLSAAFVLVLSTLAASMPFILFQNANAAGTVVVSPSSPSGWMGVDDNGFGGSMEFVNGPATPPLGSGSAELSITTTSQGYMLAKYGYGGTKISDISALSYDTYVQQGNNTIAPSLQLNIVADASSPSWQGRLVYEPYYNGTVVDGTWQSHDTLAGKWWFSKANLFGNNCAQSSPCTISQITTLYPNLAINPADSLIGFKVGSNWIPFTGNVDNFTFNSDTYDFELPTPIDVYVDGSYTSASAGGHTWGYDAFDNLQDSLNAVAVGGTVHLMNDLTLTNQVVISKEITFEGNNHTLQPTFARVGNTNAAAIDILANNVAINELTVDGSLATGNMHGLQAYNVTGVNLWRVTLENNHAYGLVVNGSWVQGVDLHTSNNGWGGVNVDQGQGVTNVATFRDAGINSHSESLGLPHLYVDRYDASQRTVDDSNNQYVYVDNYLQPGDRAYFLKSLAPAAPTNLRVVPLENGMYSPSLTPSNQWDAVPGADSYEYRTVYNNGVSTYSDSSISQPGRYSTASGVVTRTNGPSPETDYKWQVRAGVSIGSATLWGDWSDYNNFVIDATKPQVSISSVSQDSLNNVTFSGVVSDVNLNYYYCWLTTNSIVTVDGHTYTPGQEVKLGNDTISTRDASCVTKWASGATNISGTLGNFNVTGLPSGSYTVHLAAFDKAKNSIGTEGSVSEVVLVDHDGPAATITTSGTQATATPTIEGTVDADAASLELTIDGVLQTLTWAAGDTTWSFTTAALADGVHTIQILARDALGNEGGQNGTITIETPVAPLDNNPNAPAPTPQATVTPGQVLGDDTQNTQNTDNNDNTGVEGTSTEKTVAQATDTDSSDDTILGLAWYWWLLIAAAVAAFIWWLIAALRRRNTANEN